LIKYNNLEKDEQILTFVELLLVVTISGVVMVIMWVAFLFFGDSLCSLYWGHECHSCYL